MMLVVDVNVILSALIRDSVTIMENWKEAKELMERIDPEDVVFVAAALSLKNSAIWSDDRDFEMQGRIKVFKTKDLARLLLKL